VCNTGYNSFNLREYFTVALTCGARKGEVGPAVQDCRTLSRPLRLEALWSGKRQSGLGVPRFFPWLWVDPPDKIWPDFFDDTDALVRLMEGKQKEVRGKATGLK
jgi:hypothetical protein